jgi:ABC-type phosphate/phosphonate transport system substrate-binding protein
MYSVTPEAGDLWRALLSSIFAAAGLPVTLIDHAPPAPLEQLWGRPDMGAVFMCGLPLSRATPPPVVLVAPVPSPPEFAGQPRYWSEFVVREDSHYASVADTLGARIALTVPGSQSGFAAALSYFLTVDHAPPLFSEIIAPTVTPLGALSAVVRREADIAPIDSYALRLLRAYRPDLTAQVRVVGQTAPTPIPPLVVSRVVAESLGSAVDALRTAFLEAHRNALAMGLMDRLLLQRFELVDAQGYRTIGDQFDTATRHWRERPLASVTHPAFVL